MEQLYSFLIENKIDYLKDEPMKNHTTFKIGGNSQCFITVKNIAQLVSTLKFINTNDIDCFILGKGSNLLVPDEGINGAVIFLDGEFSNISVVDESTIYAGAGASLMRVCKLAMENSLEGMEFAYGIPGSVGGAVFMNAGAYGGEMKNILVSADYVTDTGETGTLTNQEMNLGYRTSAFKNNNYIIVGCTIKLTQGNKETIKEKMNDFLGRRKSKQPIEYPSAGSTFKRPDGAYAGTLIESCGLKGFSIGGAQVSEKHAGFVINTGNATSKDVNNLIDYIQNKVKEETGFFLEPEVIRL